MSIISKVKGLNLIGFKNKKCSISDNLSSLGYYCSKKKIPYRLLGVNCLRKRKKNNLHPEYDNIICLQPFELTKINLSYLKNKIYALWVWEYKSLPKIFERMEHKFNHIFTVSIYCQKIFQVHLRTPVSVIPIKSPILEYLSLIPKHNIESTQVNKVIEQTKNTNIFGYCFDFNSSLIRKNPLNLVKAFNNIFMNSQKYSLILKFRKPKYIMRSEKEIYDLLSKLIDDNTSIFTIDEELSNLDLYKLYTHLTFYISPHSCEGYGLTIFDNIILGNKIISNYYSGEKDFLIPGKFYELKHTIKEFPELSEVPAYKDLPNFYSSYVSETEITDCFKKLKNN